MGKHRQQFAEFLCNFVERGEELGRPNQRARIVATSSNGRKMMGGAPQTEGDGTD